jgi:hypothetical protein
VFFAAARMSAFGTKQTYRSACYFVCFRGEADSQRSVFHDAIRYWALHATIASGRVRLATDGGAKIAR